MEIDKIMTKYNTTIKGKSIICPSSDIKNPQLYKYIQNIVKSIKNVMSKNDIRKVCVRLTKAEYSQYYLFHINTPENKRNMEYAIRMCEKLSKQSPPFGYGIQELTIEKENV